MMMLDPALLTASYCNVAPSFSLGWSPAYPGQTIFFCEVFGNRWAFTLQSSTNAAPVSVQAPGEAEVMLLKEFKVLVDPSSYVVHDHHSAGPGALVVSGGQAHVLASAPNGDLKPHTIGTAPNWGKRLADGFTRWQIVALDGAGSVKVFERV